MNRRRNQTLVFLFAAVVFIWVSSLSSAYPIYQHNRYFDPFAMTNSLFPFYYVSILLHVLLCFGCIYHKIKDKRIHILLLTQFSLMMWFTPYFLSGFSRFPDTLLHTGASRYVPDALSDTPIQFTSYVKDFPISFIFHKVFMDNTSIDIFTYGRLIYPSLCAATLALLLYVFVSHLFNRDTAFISVLIAIPGLHHIEIHPSPHSLGLIFLFIVLGLTITLEKPDRKMLSLGFAMAFALIMSHPVTPLVLLIFMAIPPLISRGKLPFTYLGIFLVACGWFAWSLIHATEASQILAESIYDVLTLRYAERISIITQAAAGKSANFIYPEITLLHVLIVYSYLAIALLLLSSHAELTGEFPKEIRSAFLSLRYKRSLMLIAALLLILFAQIITLSRLSIGLRERSLTISIIAVSTFIGSSLLEERFRYPTKIRFVYLKMSICVWFMLIAVMYPVVSYSGEAASSYPPSEGVGMSFLVSRVPLEKRRISMDRSSQLMAYVNPNLAAIAHFPPNSEDARSLDIIVFRRSAYFWCSMTVDLSFENNSYTRSQALVDGSHSHSKIYSGLTFEIYVRNG